MKEIRDKLSIITEDLTNKALLIIQFKGVTVRGRGQKKTRRVSVDS